MWELLGSSRALSTQVRVYGTAGSAWYECDRVDETTDHVDRKDVTVTSPTITSPALAKLLGCSHMTVYKAAESGLDLGNGATLYPLRIGKRLMWPAMPIYTALGLPVPEDTGAVA